MDDGRFDAMVRVLGSDAPRRRVLAGLLASVPLALGRNAAAKKKCKKGKKKCGNRCIPKSNCCTAAQCDANETCTNGKCTCIPNCTGKECGADGCGGVCGPCNQFPNSTCTAEGQCICDADCTSKACGGDGCGGSCGQCQNGTCTTGQCVCPFPQSGETCSPGVCCPSGQACVDSSCGACPEAPDPCLPAQEHFCGRTSAPSPFCFCVTSVDEDTTCSSIFVNPSQSAPCDADDDCTGILGFGVDTVCVHAPCLGLGFDKVCMNKGCVNLNAQRSGARADGDAPAMEQRSFRKRD